MNAERSEHILKLAEMIKENSAKETTPTPKMVIPKCFDLEVNVGIGDVMVALTLIPGLKERLPGWTIRLISDRPDWARLGYDHVLHPKERENTATQGEQVYRLFGDGKDWQLKEIAAIEQGVTRHGWIGAELQVVPKRVPLRITDDMLYWAKNMLQNEKKFPIVGLAPYATMEQRCWGEDNWVQLADMLLDNGIAPIMIGGPKDGERSKYFPCMRFWGLDAQRVAALLSQCSVVVGNDSGMPHVAAMLNIPTIALGAITSTPAIFEWYGNVLCLQVKSACTTCYGLRERGFQQHCWYRCRRINEIRPDFVFQEVKKKLA